VVVGRQRGAQLLASCGLILLVLSLATMGATVPVRNSDAVERSAPELLDIPSVHDQVADEFVRSIERLYAPQIVAPETLAVAAERMVANGYVVDDFQRALGVAHPQWLDGADLLVVLDSTVVTEAALAGLRDADLAVADQYPPGRMVETEPIAMPWDVSAESVAGLARNAGLVALVSLVLVAAGGVLTNRRDRWVKAIARAVVAMGLLLGLSALVLPVAGLRSVDDRIAVIGALIGPMLVPLLILSAVILFIGFTLHAVADRLVASIERGFGSQRQAKAAAPVRTGTRPTGRRAGRHREEAIDAFFEPTAPDGSESNAVIDARGVDDSADDDESLRDAETEPEVATPMTPEQERAAALATERREALERIDGTRSGNRTHLPR
jgi:hypothetical protein